MKKLITIAFIIVATASFAQDDFKVADSLAVIQFNAGIDLYKADKFDSAIIVWKEIVNQKNGRVEGFEDPYSSAFFNIPVVYRELKNYDQARIWYKKVLHSALDDGDETGSLMSPHANYKHRAAMSLASLAKKDSNYQEVLDWLNQADTLYRYWGFEGSATSVTKEQAYMLGWKVNTLLELKLKDEAIREIIIELICAGNIPGYFDYSTDTLISLVNKETFIDEFDEALSKLRISQVDKNNWIAKFIFNNLEYKIDISDTYPDHSIPHYWRIHFIKENSKPDKEEFVDFIKERSFYKSLQP